MFCISYIRVCGFDVSLGALSLSEFLRPLKVSWRTVVGI